MTLRDLSVIYYVKKKKNTLIFINRKSQKNCLLFSETICPNILLSLNKNHTEVLIGISNTSVECEITLEKKKKTKWNLTVANVSKFSEIYLCHYYRNFRIFLRGKFSIFSREKRGENFPKFISVTTTAIFKYFFEGNSLSSTKKKRKEKKKKEITSIYPTVFKTVASDQTGTLSQHFRPRTIQRPTIWKRCQKPRSQRYSRLLFNWDSNGPRPDSTFIFDHDQTAAIYTCKITIYIYPER